MTMKLEQELLATLAREVELIKRFQNAIDASPFFDALKNFHKKPKEIRALSSRAFLKLIFAIEDFATSEEHSSECEHGAACSVFEIIDALIMVRNSRLYLIGAYHEADSRDYDIIRKGLVQWRNYRSVTE